MQLSSCAVISCRCDLATLSQISNAEDILEELTAGAKVVRSQFCKVPVDLIIDCSKLQALNIEKNDESMPGVLSHESLPKMAFQRYIYDNSPLQFSSSGHTSNQPSVGGDRSSTDDLHPGRLLVMLFLLVDFLDYPSLMYLQKLFL